MKEPRSIGTVSLAFREEVEREFGRPLGMDGFYTICKAFANERFTPTVSRETCCDAILKALLRDFVLCSKSFYKLIHSLGLGS